MPRVRDGEFILPEQIEPWGNRMPLCHRIESKYMGFCCNKNITGYRAPTFNDDSNICHGCWSFDSRANRYKCRVAINRTYFDDFADDVTKTQIAIVDFAHDDAGYLIKFDADETGDEQRFVLILLECHSWYQYQFTREYFNIFLLPFEEQQAIKLEKQRNYEELHKNASPTRHVPTVVPPPSPSKSVKKQGVASSSERPPSTPKEEMTTTNKNAQDAAVWTKMMYDNAYQKGFDDCMKIAKEKFDKTASDIFEHGYNEGKKDGMALKLDVEDEEED